MEKSTRHSLLNSAPGTTNTESLQWTYPLDEQYLADVYDTYLSDESLTKYDKKFGLVDLEPSTLDEKALFIPILSDELRMYPPFMIMNVRLQPIHLVSKLRHKETKKAKPRSIAGLATNNRDIYLVTDPQSTDYFGRIVHHEVFHIFDYHYTGQKRERRIITPSLPKREPTSVDQRIYTSWNKTFYPGEEPYLHREYHKSVPDTAHDQVVVEFGRKYGMKNPMEDRATIFEEMMTNLPELLERMRDDSVLYRKYCAIQKDLQGWSYGWMGKQYFEDLEAGQVGPGYFA